MSYRILVPLDGSELADKVVPWADAWAGSTGAEVELLRAVSAPVPSVFADGASVADYYFTDADALGAHQDLLATAAAFTKTQRVDVKVVEGAPRDAILDRARDQAIDLIMMTTHGRGGLTRTVLGSVSGSVLRRSGIPVVTIRADLAGPPREPRRMLVPLNDSDLAAAILPQLVILAKALTFDLVLYWVAPAFHDSPTSREAIQQLADGLQAAQIHAEVEIEYGADPAAMIVSRAEAAHFDLIAMSTHGRSGLSRWTLGSVTEWTIRHANVPVMAIRPHDLSGRLESPETALGAQIAEPVA